MNPTRMMFVTLLLVLLSACGRPPGSSLQATLTPSTGAPAPEVITTPVVSIPPGAVLIPTVAGYEVRIGFHHLNTLGEASFTELADVEVWREPGKDGQPDTLVVITGPGDQNKVEVSLNTRIQVDTYPVWLDGNGNVAYNVPADKLMWVSYVQFLHDAGVWEVTPRAHRIPLGGHRRQVRGILF